MTMSKTCWISAWKTWFSCWLMFDVMSMGRALLKGGRAFRPF
jgi:hypothetical protein